MTQNVYVCQGQGHSSRSLLCYTSKASETAEQAQEI